MEGIYRRIAAYRLQLIARLLVFLLLYLEGLDGDLDLVVALQLVLYLRQHCVILCLCGIAVEIVEDI
jgi:hypothetical protein